MGSSYFSKKLIKTIPKEITEATKAAIARAVPALSVSTTVRTAAAGAAGLPTPAPIGALAPADGLMPGFAAGLPAGSGGLAAGNATVAPGPGDLVPAAAGRGGNEIRMVSLRKSAGGFASPGTPGTEGGPPAGTTGGEPGSLGRAGTAGGGGMEGNVGLGGGASRMVSFFRPDPGGLTGAGATTGLGTGGTIVFAGIGIEGAGLILGPGIGNGGLGMVGGGTPGAPVARGGLGGKGTPSGIRR